MGDHNKVSVIEECKKFISTLSESGKENQEQYDNYAELYDKMMDMGYKTPEILAEMCMKHLNKNLSETVLLDVASGTGLMAQTLKTFGYKGSIDGIEANAKMIEECMKKNKIYREIKQHYLSEDQPMPYSDDTYDIVICAGALCMGHIPPECIRDMIRVLKSEGILLFNVANLECDKKNVTNQAVKELMNQMALENRCKLVEEVSKVGFENPQQKVQFAEKTFYYCFRK